MSAGAPTLAVTPLPTSVEVAAGDDLPALVLRACADAGVALRDGDVVAVASKVIAKAEGAVVALPAAQDTDHARRLLARQQARRVVADAPGVLVVETHHGLVCANAGIDTSNVPGTDTALLLPADPDDSAARLRTGLVEATGATVGVVVTDTFGRPWRLGQTDVAVGAAGVTVLRDDRATADRLGDPLTVTLAAVGDALAAAADLVRRKDDGVPFVLLRGLDVLGPGRAADLRRESTDDLFPAGGPTIADHALATAATAVRGLDDTAPGRPLPGDLLSPLGAVVDAATDRRVAVTVAPDGCHLRGPAVEVGAARTAAVVWLAARGWWVAPRPTADGLRLRIGRSQDVGGTDRGRRGRGRVGRTRRRPGSP